MAFPYYSRMADKYGTPQECAVSVAGGGGLLNGSRCLLGSRISNSKRRHGWLREPAEGMDGFFGLGPVGHCALIVVDNTLSHPGEAIGFVIHRLRCSELDGLLVLSLRGSCVGAGTPCLRDGQRALTTAPQNQGWL